MTALEDLTRIITDFTSGWGERIEYAIQYQTHTDGCAAQMAQVPHAQLKHYECQCSTARELRAETRHQDSLIAQLVDAKWHVPQNGSSSGGNGGSVNKPESKIPGNLAGPDELLQRLATTACEYAEAWDVHATPPGVVSGWLRALLAAAPDRDDPDDIHQLLHDLRQHHHRARVLLGYDSDTQFLNETCDCGGLLRVARDLDTRAEVRCAGTTANLPCGARHPWKTWLDMGNRSRLVPTDAAAEYANLHRNRLYRLAHDGKITRYGGSGKGQALWDLNQLAEYRIEPV